MAGKINVPVSVAIQGVANVSKQFQILSGNLNKVGKTAGLAAAGFSVFAAAVKAGDFAATAVEGARDLERNMLGLKSVFQEVTPQMVAFSQGAESVGLSLNEASKASTFIGSVLKQSGFSFQETADLTERLVKLGTDLSLTYGYDVSEALMGMTALFRGEYDPIEKFGVAMKQSEINSELAAKGLDHLEGAARRFAEQQIRVELLFQRSQSAQGAFERGTGTLAVEQLKLAAAFANVKDTVAVSMLPVLGGIFQNLQESVKELQPALEEAFEAAAPALQNMADVLLPVVRDLLIMAIEGFTQFAKLVEDVFDPTTSLGEAFVALGANVESLIDTFTGPFAALEVDVFDVIRIALEFVANALSDIIRFVDITIIGFQALGKMIGYIITGQFDKLINTDWMGMVQGQIAVRDAFVAQQIAVAQVNKELRETERQTKRITQQAAGLSLSNLPKYIRDNLKGNNTVTPPAPETKDTKVKATNYVKDFYDGIKEEVAKQKARLKLEGLGASEGLIDQILGSQGWEKVFKRVLASGTAGLKRLQSEFNRTAAGIKEIESARKAAEEDAKAAIEKAQKAADELWQAYEDAKQAAEDFKRSIMAISRIDILPTIKQELGEFEDQIVNTFESVREELAQGLYDKRIFQQDYDTLMAYVATEERALRAIAAQRDDLAKRRELSKAIIEEYRQALTASLSLTSLLSNVKEETETKTVKETTSGIMRLGKSLREFGVTVTREFEQTVKTTQNKTETVLSGFRDMAAKARVFAENLRKLRAMGLDDQLFNQLVQAGVEAGGETAQALVDGGSATINEINSLFKEIDSLGADLGEEVAATLYGTGIDMANGLIEGIASKQSALEAQARAMAEAFNAAFAAKISVAVEAPVAQAQQAAQAAQDAVPKLEEINLDALAKVNGLIAGAERFIRNVSDATRKAGGQTKLDIYNMLREDILAGQQVDLSGIRSGMTTQELATASGKGQVTNNININVQTDATQSTAMVGKQLGTIITSYVQTGGLVAV